MEIEVKKLDPKAQLPVYFYEGDAGMNLFALEDIVIPTLQRVSVRTGIAMAIPTGYVGLILDRSSVAAKYGIHHFAGVIDSGYRGEILVVLYNSTTEDYKIAAGDKIAQMLIQPVASPELLEVKELVDSERAQGGFGSTGK